MSSQELSQMMCDAVITFTDFETFFDANLDPDILIDVRQKTRKSKLHSTRPSNPLCKEQSGLDSPVINRTADGPEPVDLKTDESTNHQSKASFEVKLKHVSSQESLPNHHSSQNAKPGTILTSDLL